MKHLSDDFGHFFLSCPGFVCHENLIFLDLRQLNCRVILNSVKLSYFEELIAAPTHFVLQGRDHFGNLLGVLLLNPLSFIIDERHVEFQRIAARRFFPGLWNQRKRQAIGVAPSRVWRFDRFVVDHNHVRLLRFGGSRWRMNHGGGWHEERQSEHGHGLLHFIRVMNGARNVLITRIAYASPSSECASHFSTMLAAVPVARRALLVSIVEQVAPGC